MTRVMHRFMDSDKKGTLENVLSMYLNKLQAREQFLQECNGRIHKQKDQQREIEQRLKQLQFEKK